MILTSFLSSKAWGRVTVAREGMSRREEGIEEALSRMMWWGRRKDLLSSPSVVSVVSLGKSCHYFTVVGSLRMINSVESLSLNLNALQPSRMVVNSGKSIHHSLFTASTNKDCTKTVTECSATKQKGFQFGQVYSSSQLLRTTLQFQWSMPEIETPSIQSSHFNHFQRRHILNLKHGIIPEGRIPNLQFSQPLTILQTEMTF